MHVIWNLPIFFALMLVSATALGVMPTKDEMSRSHSWSKLHFGDGKTAPMAPFSFVYDGKPSSSLFANWTRSATAVKKLDKTRTQRTITYTDPNTGLQIRCVAVEFGDFPAAEWTVYLKNTASVDTPIITDIRALDVNVIREGDSEFVLNHNSGDVHDDGFNYEPLKSVLKPDSNLQLAAFSGFPCQHSYPYFNLEWQGRGMVLAIGWPGQWSAQFDRDGQNGLHITAGQQFARFKLHPGEEVRTPRIVILHWQGDAVRGQNLWRRWMIAHNMPRPGGKLPGPVIAAGNSTLFDYTGMTEQNQIEFIDAYIREKIPVDYWWVDAGWYSVPEGLPWWNYGTWEYDRTRFPNGLKPAMEHARANGLKTVLWFCPEPVRPRTDLRLKHPEWLLGPEEFSLLYLGNPDAWKWLVEHTDAFINELKIDVYRNDNDVPELDYWRNNDEPDRLGITEIRHLTGLLSFFDEIQRRHPKILIDNCCAGGRRNDIEMLRRSVPLWRSDYWDAPEQMQCQTLGMALWIPYFGHATGQLDDYTFRSNIHPSGGILWHDMRRSDLDFAKLRKEIDQLRETCPDFLGDYYPLTPYSRENNVWIAWQFDRPEAGRGFIQAFRRKASGDESQRYKLQGLDLKAWYEVTDVDENIARRMSGAELMDKGLTVRIPATPGAALIIYKNAR